ncbi:hypothetical protein UC34_24340 [Pandoraea vervacti]|uniref:Transmembrane protein n=1 Tax=Pandoraea vervacti TaxID=656178 RepID=A0ABM5T2X9_9BURK|nr:hypothetical protein [Pandoraea vervacti]AJP59238.1 hypothetical protein UC34_24340 [Pandoraea vervacti]
MIFHASFDSPQRFGVSLAPNAAHVSSASFAPSSEGWRHVTVTQRNVPSLEEKDTSRSLEGVKASIVKELNSIREKWAAMLAEVDAEVDYAPLPEDFSAINQYVAHVGAALRAQGDDMLAIDSLPPKLEMAMKKIYRSRQLPWGTWKTVGSQRTITDIDALTPNAKAAFVTLSRIDVTVRDIGMMLDAVNCAETRRKAILREHLHAPHSLSALEKRRHVAKAFAAIGRALFQTALIIHKYLQQATAAIPRERRRWKTKIGIIVALAAISASLAIAAALLPAALPTLAGVALGLKFGSICVGILGAVHSMFSVIGYSRNRGWTEMSGCIERVRNVYVVISTGICARQSAAGWLEADDLGQRLKRLTNVLGGLETTQATIAHKLTVS